MITVILIADKDNDLSNLKHSLESKDDVIICGVYTEFNLALNDVESMKPDIVFIGTKTLCWNDVDKMYYIRQLTELAKVVFFTQLKENALTYYELKELDYYIKDRQDVNNLIDASKRTKDDSDTKKKSYKITCFGKLTVLDREHVEFTKWRTKKVKELFSYLLCRYGKSISKEELAMVLFSGEDKKRALNHLYVTMSYLRNHLKLLGLSRQEFLIKDDYTLEINNGICDFIDFERFMMKHASIDDDNIAEAERVCALYKGMFLEEEDYLWAYDIREYTDKKYEDMILLMSDYYRDKKLMKKAEKVLLKILSYNPLSLNAHFQLMDLYILFNKKDSFTKEYYKYKDVLEIEFGEEPLPKYLNYYKNSNNII